MAGYKYFSEDIDNLVDIADDFLNRPTYIYGEYMMARLRYESIYTSLTSIGVSYDSERVQTSHISYDDRLVEIAELSSKCESLLKQYEIERTKLYNELQNIDFTDDEYFVLHHRHLVREQLSFEQIARKHKHIDRKRAFYIYTKAYIKVANYLEDKAKHETHL